MFTGTKKVFDLNHWVMFFVKRLRFRSSMERFEGVLTVLTHGQVAGGQGEHPTFPAGTVRSSARREPEPTVGCDDLIRGIRVAG